MRSQGACLLFGFIMVGTAAIGAEDFQIAALEELMPGVPQPGPPGAIVSTDVVGVEGSSPILTGAALLTQFKDDVPRTRGPRDISLFREAAPSVVLIQTEVAFGSGSVVKDNVILTNLHVVGTKRQVTVVFKPSDPSGKPKDDEVTRADVIKVDRQRDLALLRPKSLPSRSVRPLEIAPQETIDVGSDVSAIGHPRSEFWSYTRGIVSGFRPDYSWSEGPGTDQYRATVIQTQTPINPGNSGGPLLAEDGKLVGVNSFRTPESEGLNFAVAAKDVRIFVASTKGDRDQVSCDGAKTIFEGRNSKNTGFMRSISVSCDGKADLVIFVADDQSKPIVAYVDLKRRGKPEGIVYDQNRTGKWNLSFWDVKFDDTFALKGLHPEGKLMPSKYEPRCPTGSIPLLNFKCSQT